MVDTDNYILASSVRQYPVSQLSDRHRCKDCTLDPHGTAERQLNRFYMGVGAQIMQTVHWVQVSTWGLLLLCCQSEAALGTWWLVSQSKHCWAGPGWLAGSMSGLYPGVSWCQWPVVPPPHSTHSCIPDIDTTASHRVTRPRGTRAHNQAS